MTARATVPARLGPRPLGLHLSTVMGMLLTSGAALPSLRTGLPAWKPHLRGRAAELAARVAAAGAEEVGRALDREVRRQIDQVLTGIERYRHHPYRRDLTDPPSVWTEGASRLLDYGPDDGVPALFVPSLVNRAYILDLSRERSLVRWLASQGVRPLLMDWGTPGPWERRLTLTDLIAGRLARALDATVELTGRPAALVGYCMGGLLATALALHRPRLVSRLGLLATPWDFHAEDAATARSVASFFHPFGPLVEGWGELPTDVIQALFARLDPFLVLRKFRQFARMDPDSPAARGFVALEDWLNDGVALPAAVAREALAGWYGRNDPACGRWMVAGLPVEPARLRLPTLALIPERDRIVPPASALGLANAIPGAQIVAPPLGHIGMVVSGGAKGAAWQPLAEWLRATG